MMSSPWSLILLHLTVLSSATGYTFPLPDKSSSTGPHTTGEYSSSPLVWEWETQDKSHKTLLTLIRMVRELSDKKTSVSQPDVKYPSKVEKVSKSPLEKYQVTPKIALPSKVPYIKPKMMEQHIEDDTTPLDELDHTATKEDTTTQTDKSPTPAIKTIATQMKFSTQQQLSVPGSTMSKGVTVFPKSTAKKATTVNEATTVNKATKVNEATTANGATTGNEATTVIEAIAAIETTTIAQIHSSTVNSKLLSSKPDSTTSTVVEERTSSLPSKIPKDTPSQPTTSKEPTTHAETSVWIRDSKDSSTTPVSVTHIATTSEDKILSQSIIKQCMLAILILAVLCTIFIITTIALAAKLSTMRQKQKLRHPATYTEMRCISSLLPESDQQSKVKSKRLKTFAAMEESDGDNTTLNSFLPDH